MEESILQEVSKVFGLSLEDTQEFINNMDKNAPIPEGYFTALLQKLPKPNLVEFPKKPANLPARRIYPTSQKNYWQKVFKNQRNKYNENMKQYQTKLSTFESTRPTNDTLFVNENEYSAEGISGYVKPNKKSPSYIYKFMKHRALINDAYIKSLMTEPLINCILQQDPIGKKFTCELYKVFVILYETDFQLILKLENLKGDQVSAEFSGKLGSDKDKNLDTLVQVFGPLLEALQALRAKYKFEHGDLHGENMMFVNKPNLTDKTNLDIKMVDFGRSSMFLGNKQFGIKQNPFRETYYLVQISDYGYLPVNFSLTLDSLLLNGEYEEVALLFLDVHRKMKKGGKRGQTRKHKSKRKQTRKH